MRIKLNHSWHSKTYICNKIKKHEAKQVPKYSIIYKRGVKCIIGVDNIICINNNTMKSQ